MKKFALLKKEDNIERQIDVIIIYFLFTTFFFYETIYFLDREKANKWCRYWDIFGCHSLGCCLC